MTETDYTPKMGDLVKIEGREARVTRVDRQRRRLDALLTRQRDPIAYAGRPWKRVEFVGRSE